MSRGPGARRGEDVARLNFEHCGKNFYYLREELEGALHFSYVNLQLANLSKEHESESVHD